MKTISAPQIDSDKEADERLAKNVENYVINKGMPINVAEKIIHQYVSKKKNFARVWEGFLERIGNHPSVV